LNEFLKDLWRIRSNRGKVLKTPENSFAWPERFEWITQVTITDVQTFKMMVAVCHMDMIVKHLETKMIQGTLVSMPLINTTGCRSV
jgi:hypothetical protein